MAQFNDTGYGSLTLTGTVPQFARVTAAGVVATASQKDVGTAQVAGVSGDVVAYHYANKQGTTKMIASEAITANASCFAAADGEVAADGTVFVGVALQAATADQDIIEVLRFDGNGTSGGVLDAAQQALAAGGGAVNVTTYYTSVASDAGGDAITLADGTFPGQLKKIKLITDGGGDAVLTPANFSNGATITFADVGDYAVLLWNGTEWTAVEVGNDADGATAPVIA